MNAPHTIATWDVLHEFGFEPDADSISGVSFDFGNFKLSAMAETGKTFEPVVLFTGVLETQRKLAEVIFEIPPTVASREQLAAFIVYYLDKAAGRDAFQPKRNVDWIAEGRKHRQLLPWEVDKAAYRSRPHCTVRRDWLRLALNNLTEQLVDADDTDLVEFGFDGSVLTIRFCGQVMHMAAEGTPWPAEFNILAKSLRRLPKRLMQSHVEVAVYKGRLRIGRVCFEVATKRMSLGTHWPADWPGRQIVDLDNVGDPGQWIDELIPCTGEVLNAAPEEDQKRAEVLADAFIGAGKSIPFSLPTEFGMSEEDMLRITIDDFIGFIREWRKRTLAEQQAALIRAQRNGT